jgi:putative protease
VLADKQKDYADLGLWAARLMFSTENPRECVQVLERYLNKNNYMPSVYTRGLYYRGVE